MQPAKGPSPLPPRIPLAKVLAACLAVFAAALALATWAPHLDEAIMDLVPDGDAGRSAWRIASWPGDTWTGVAVAATALALTAAVGRGPRRWWTGGTAVALLAATVVLVQGLKALLQRERPEGSVLPTHAFPSGHAAMAVVACGAAALLLLPLAGRRWPGLLRWRPGAIGAAATLAFLGGLGRVLGGVHWPTDVLAGWALGGAILALGVAIGSHPPPAVTAQTESDGTQAPPIAR